MVALIGPAAAGDLMFPAAPSAAYRRPRRGDRPAVPSCQRIALGLAFLVTAITTFFTFTAPLFSSNPSIGPYVPSNNSLSLSSRSSNLLNSTGESAPPIRKSDVKEVKSSENRPKAWPLKEQEERSVWRLPPDKALLYAKSEIENAPLLTDDIDLHPPLFRNLSVFKRSYELMEKILKVYIYKDGKAPIFHKPELQGIYASEGWFMKLMEEDRRFAVNDPKRAHLFYLPYSSRQLELALYVPNSHNLKPLSMFLKDYVNSISSKYPFWNRTRGADHFLVACHDWAIILEDKFLRTSFCKKVVVMAGHDGFSIAEVRWLGPYQVVSSGLRSSPHSARRGRLTGTLQAEGPYTTTAHEELRNNTIKALCNADASEGIFVRGRDVSLPETTIRTPSRPLRYVGGRRVSQRPILAFFAGNMHGKVRPTLIEYWGDKEDDMRIYKRLPNRVSKKLSYVEHMRSSKFCICPEGYEVNSPRIVEAIYSGCVPVIIADNFILPFEEVLDWSSFSVVVAEKDIPNLKPILMGISLKRYISLQTAVMRLQRHFLWHARPEKYDLFHMILHSIWFSRLNQIQIQQ